MVQELNPTVLNASRESIKENMFFKHKQIPKPLESSLKHKQIPKYKLKPQLKPKPKDPKVVIKRHYQYQDRLFKAEHHKCDLCDDHLSECKDNIEAYIDMMDDINNSYESLFERTAEPKSFTHEEELMINSQCNAIQNNLTSPSPKDQKWFRANCLELK